MIISEVTIEELKSYAHVYHSEDDALFEAILSASKAYIQGYTGLSSESLDLHEDITLALLVLSNELYDNRTFTVDNVKANQVVQSILGMYSINLL